MITAQPCAAFRGVHPVRCPPPCTCNWYVAVRAELGRARRARSASRAPHALITSFVVLRDAPVCYVCAAVLRAHPNASSAHVRTLHTRIGACQSERKMRLRCARPTIVWFRYEIESNRLLSSARNDTADRRHQFGFGHVFAARKSIGPHFAAAAICMRFVRSAQFDDQTVSAATQTPAHKQTSARTSKHARSARAAIAAAELMTLSVRH